MEERANCTKYKSRIVQSSGLYKTRKKRVKEAATLK